MMPPKVMNWNCNETLRVDLHLHTSMSDGVLCPRDMVTAAIDANITIMAITDHDALDGLPEAILAGNETGISIVTGIELSCGQGEEIHLLGYGMAPESPALKGFLDKQLERRQERMRAMLEKLDALGMPVAEESVKSRNKRFMGRMNLASAMAELGYVQTPRQAFTKYLNPGKAAYVPRERVTVAQGIAALEGAGAIPVLAHPGRYKLDAVQLKAILPEWLEAGLMGIEAHHASHTPAQAAVYRQMAQANGLLITGGSDCHSRPDGARIGEHIPAWHNMVQDVSALMQCIETRP